MALSPDTMKGLALGLMFLVAVIGVIIVPILLKKRNIEFLFGQAMAAGTLIVAALLHLLPEAVEFAPKPRELTAGVICVSTFVSLVLIESIATHIWSKPEEDNSPASGGSDKKDAALRSSNNSKLGKVKETSAIGVGALCLFVALSVHSIIEGFALGAQHSIDNMTTTLISIVAHKGLAGLALGQTLLKANYRVCTFLCMGIAFALFSPIGLVIGWVLDWSSCHPGIGVANAMAAGTFLFTGAYEILPHLFETRGKIVQKSLGLIAGAGLLMLLIILMDGGAHEHNCPGSHDHGHDDHGDGTSKEHDGHDHGSNSQHTDHHEGEGQDGHDHGKEGEGQDGHGKEGEGHDDHDHGKEGEGHDGHDHTTTTTTTTRVPPPPAPTTTTTTTTTLACSSSGTDNMLTCLNGDQCSYEADGWSCCKDRGGRERCPKNLPYMCNDKRCKGDHCCKGNANNCDDKDGSGVILSCPTPEPTTTTTTTTPVSTTTTTTTTVGCPSSGSENMLTCLNGEQCDYKVDGWSCCADHDGRERCPANLPYMCKDQRCKGDHCCKSAPAKCDDSGGLILSCPTRTASSRSGTIIDSEICDAATVSIIGAIVVTFMVTAAVMSCIFCCYIKKCHVASLEEKPVKGRDTMTLSTLSSTTSGWPKFENQLNASATSQVAKLRSSRRKAESKKE